MSDDIDQLSQKIDKAQGKKALTPEQAQAAKDAENKRVGLQAGFELVGSVAAGVIAGLALDGWLGTKPLFLILLFFLGVCVGFYNIYRVTNNMGSSVGFSQLHKGKKDAKTPPGLENTDN